MSGSATADTSAIVRPGQSVSCCQAGLSTQAGQPLPDPAQADSCQPRSLSARVSEVPPTAMTLEYAAGTVGTV
ncbi:hypothetical protein [Streptomyces sp. NPDC101234]|uniref:hypothetical protein n=1 Tax=Streptomyces sp. NPDC101234 TaxID=3366138 RepID=UPI0038274208